MGINEQAFYRWKKQYVGLENRSGSAVEAASGLQVENKNLKKLVAELSLDKAMLQDVLAKKFLNPSRRRPVVHYLCGVYRVSSAGRALQPK